MHRSFSGHRSPGTSVPSSEQKQSGSLQRVLSHLGALLGSVSASRTSSLSSELQNHSTFLPHTFSSEPSAQSGIPLQKRVFWMQVASPQANSLAWLHTGSSVTSRGLTFFSRVSLSQFFTAHFQSHVCFSRSKASPGGHLMACKPWINYK